MGNESVLRARQAALDKRDAVLLAYIESLIAGKLDAAPPPTDDALSAAIAKFAAKVAGDTSDDLDRIVTLSIQGNEAAISTARLLTATRESDNRTHSLAAASEELASSIGQIGDTAKGAAADAAQMRASAEHGMVTVDSARTAMERVASSANEASQKVTALSEASAAIGNIVSAIDAIARQTNLLALNATIEAARAGEAGKGFAVVATEVKTLSQETSKSTEDIRARIDSLRAKMTDIVAAMEKGAGAVAHGRESVTAVGGQLEDIAHRFHAVTDSRPWATAPAPLSMAATMSVILARRLSMRARMSSVALPV